jgi:hypothetical protein
VDIGRFASCIRPAKRREPRRPKSPPPLTDTSSSVGYREPAFLDLDRVRF